MLLIPLIFLFGKSSLLGNISIYPSLALSVHSDCNFCSSSTATQDWDLVWSSIIRFKKCKQVWKNQLITFFDWWKSYRAFLSSSCQACHFHFGYVMTQDGHHFQTLFITSPVKSGMDTKKCEKEGEEWELFKRCIRPLSDLTLNIL